MFHKHVWKIVEEKEQPSPIELLRESGASHMKGFGDWAEVTRRPIIVRRICETCGTEEVRRV